METPRAPWEQKPRCLAGQPGWAHGHKSQSASQELCDPEQFPQHFWTLISSLVK